MQSKETRKNNQAFLLFRTRYPYMCMLVNPRNLDRYILNHEHWFVRSRTLGGNVLFEH